MPLRPTASAPALIQGGHQFVIDAAREDLQHGVEHVRRGDAQAVDEPALDAALGQEAGHLLAAAVHHDDFDAAALDGARDLARPGESRDSGASSSVPPSLTRIFKPSVSG